MTGPESPHQLREQALEELDALLALPALEPSHCRALLALAELVPGRKNAVARRIANQLASSPTAGVLAALLELPSDLPGVTESAVHAVSRGILRRRADGSPAPSMLAIEFPASRAKDLPQLIERADSFAQHAGAMFQALRVQRTTAGRPRLRFRLWLLETPELAGGLRRLGGHLSYLHRRIARLRGTTLWIDGWRFDATSHLRPAVQPYLVQAWVDRVIRLHPQ